MRILVLILTILFIFSGISPICAETNDLKAIDIPFELLDEPSINKINDFITEINKELDEDIPLLNSEFIKTLALEGINFNFQALFSKLLGYLFKEIVVNLSLMGKLIFLTVLCALLRNLQNSFENSSISLLSYSVCFIFLSVIALNAFYQAVALAADTVNSMVGFMQALLPLLLSLLAGIGAVTSAAFFTPLMLFIVATMSMIIKDVVFPLLFLTAVLDCVSYLTQKYKISNLTAILKQAAMGVLGFSMAIFIGITSIQGIAGSIADGLTLRSAKYAATTFIPVVGKMFSDTVEVVMSASLLLKNATGLFGFLAILMLCIVPLLKLMALIIIIKASSALVEPMGDENMAKCLGGMANNLILVFGALLILVVMFFLLVAIIVGASSMTMMLK
ncbi:stage III sporulation protein AE [Selenomonadales bacterium OttesenSCG-928-I06]|nr:stage III sporulation protein AE [Selenomonadales bacterium OttesenSCG-928-I06]